MTGSTAPAGRWGAVAATAWYGVALVAVAGLGLVNLFHPFGEDQALYMTGARAMRDGATLYIDFWNNKQPGVFLFYYFYYAAGRLFGFTEAGLHALELIWLGVFSLVLVATLRPWLRRPWLSALAPVAIVGVYYANAFEEVLSQPEILVALPTYLSVWLAAKDHGSRRGMAAAFLASGACAAVTVAFKLVLAPLFVVLWLAVSADLLVRRRSTWAEILFHAWVPVSLGVVSVLVLVAGGFWFAGALKPMLWTSFVWPLEAIGEVRRAPATRLLTAGGWLAGSFAPWLLFVAIALVAWNRIVTVMVVWIIAATALILIQSISWWTYHTLLLFPPIGVLAVLGIDRALAFFDERSDGRPVTIVMAATVLAVTLAMSQLTPFLRKTDKVLGSLISAKAGIAAYQRDVSRRYQWASKAVRFLRRGGVLPGPVYVLGDPLVQYLSGRPQAPAASGWVYEWSPSSMWRRLPDELAAARPSYVYIETAFRKSSAHDWQRLQARLDEDYTLISKDSHGVWYRLREADPVGD